MEPVSPEGVSNDGESSGASWRGLGVISWWSRALAEAAYEGF